MSTNPFRRSSLREANDGTTKRSPDVDGTATAPLAVDTRVTSSSQKHVNFASPPDYFSPASYPSSPESTRNSLLLGPPQETPLLPTNYGLALYSDPFEETAINEEGDTVIEEALQNARTNSETSPASLLSKPSKEDAVKDTLSRFASAPRRTISLHESSKSTPDAKAQRQTLDVDSFKRLLLTGESGGAASNNVAPQTTFGTHLVSDSSSTADSASISQQSIQESGNQAIDGTPRSSYEIDRGDTDTPRAVSGNIQERKPPPPPPPKPKHGRPISESISTEQAQTVRSRIPVSPSTNIAELASLSGDAPSRFDEENEAGQASSKKRPPPPPLARKKSQNKSATRPGVVRSASSKYSLNSESDEPTSPPTPSSTKMAPPPPPTRRMNAQIGRRPSVDLPVTFEEDDHDDAASINSNRPSAPKSISQAPFATPPPIPPPRKNKSSNRSSLDSQQRPSLSALGMTSSRSSSEYGRPSSTNDSRNVSGSSTAGVDILADLAALQREVDAARRHA